MSRLNSLQISHELVFRWMTQNRIDVCFTLVPAMTWFHQPLSHHVSQCWPTYSSPYDITKPQWSKCLWRLFYKVVAKEYPFKLFTNYSDGLPIGTASYIFYITFFILYFISIYHTWLKCTSICDNWFFYFTCRSGWWARRLEYHRLHHS